jgi:hypothetical protein
MFASLQAPLAKTLIDLQKRILYIDAVPVKRMIPKSGNRLSEKIMRKNRPDIRSGHSVRLC